MPDQSWKGHISVTLCDAIKIADIVVPILISKQCAFKIVKNTRLLSVINDIHYPISGANKYITFYPVNDNIFRECIYELYNALKNFKGSRIHTDFQCGLNGLVHYRYGAFIKIQKYDTQKNKFIYCIKNDKGELVKDERNPWYEKPYWIEEPFNKDSIFSKTLELSEPEIEKINEYEFISILSRANKGNVYLARIKNNGKQVVIKESNPFVYFGEKSSDTHKVLKNEFNILKAMQKSGSVPKIYEMFSCGNKYYMVEEYLTGKTLMQYSQSNNIDNYNEKIKLVYKLIHSIELFHKNGYVLRDLKPTNIIVTEDIDLKFIDLETVCSVNLSNESYFVRTEGFYNPEFNIEKCDMYNDWYAAIITILSLMLGTIPYFHDDLMGGCCGERKVMSKVVKYLEDLINNGKLKEREYELIKYIINDKINSNYSTLLSESNEAFKNVSLSYIIDCAIEGLYRQCQTAYRNQEERLWKSTEFGNMTNKFNIQHGVAGVGQFLIKYLQDNNENKEFAKKTLLIICDYIKENMEDFIDCIEDEKIEKSFLFGSYGVSWFLYDLGEYLKDNELIRYSKMLLDISDNDKHLDFALGKAGQAYTELKLFQVNHNKQNNNYGFAHGYAGIAYIVYTVGIIENNDYYKRYAIKMIDSVLDVYKKLLEVESNKIPRRE